MLYYPGELGNAFPNVRVNLKSNEISTKKARITGREKSGDLEKQSRQANRTGYASHSHPDPDYVCLSSDGGSLFEKHHNEVF